MTRQERRRTVRFISGRWTCFGIAVVVIGVSIASAQQHPASELIQRAKEEGEVVLYTAWGQDTVQALQTAFQERYPFIRLNVFRTRSERILNRTIAEHRNKMYLADVFSGSQLAMVNHKKAGHLQKYASPEQKAFPRDFKDPEDYWASFYVDTRVVGYNTRLVLPREVPRSYQDLLDPKWKGKMGMDEADYIWFGSLLEILGREAGLLYMRKLAQQQINFRSGHSLLNQLLIGGEFPLYIDAFGSNVEQSKARGAPMDWVGVEPVMVTLYPVAMAFNAPHPSAARLFIDFALSREGQAIGKKVGKIPGRADVEPLYPRLAKGLRFFPVPSALADHYGEIVKEFRSIFFH